MTNAHDSMNGCNDDDKAIMEQVNYLTAKLEAAEALVEQERKRREMSETVTAAADKRILELEQCLAKAKQEALEIAGGVAEADEQKDALQAERDKLERRLREDQAEKDELERELEQAHKIIDSLEKMVRETTKGSDRDAPEEPLDNQRLVALVEEVESLQQQLAQERAQREELAEEVSLAEKKLADLEKTTAKKPLNKNVSTFVDPKPAETDASCKPGKQAKPLPHELRPAPNPGAPFHPDWGLVGLPCKSGAQVVRAWETVFNVQISLEGYPSQYCMAFLVVLQAEQVNRLFMLFRLKQSKHTLVCVPAASPASQAQLQKAIDEGLKFLKTSGFEMEEMPEKYISSSLGSYFLEK